jgi:hypothetical protein
MMEFREQTLVRLQRFLQQRFFSIRDYLTGAHVCAKGVCRDQGLPPRCARVCKGCA